MFVRFIVLVIVLVFLNSFFVYNKNLFFVFEVESIVISWVRLFIFLFFLYCFIVRVIGFLFLCVVMMFLSSVFCFLGIKLLFFNKVLVLLISL